MINEKDEEVEIKENVQKNDKENDQKANKLCITSLGLNFVPYIIGFLLSIFTRTLNPETLIFSVVLETFSMVSRVCPVVAFIIMIYVRIKYPKNKFGKVLMVFYIVELIISIVLVCLFLFMCLSNCPG